MKQSYRQYFLWLRDTHPELYAAVYRRLMGPDGLGQVAEPEEELEWWEKGTEIISALIPVYVASEQQKALNELNLERAKLGQPPLDASQASTISTQVGLSPQTLNTLMVVGVGLAVAIGVSAFGGKKRGR